MTLFQPSTFIYKARNAVPWSMTNREANYQRLGALSRRLAYSNTGYADQVRDQRAWDRFGDDQ